VRKRLSKKAGLFSNRRCKVNALDGGAVSKRDVLSASLRGGVDSTQAPFSLTKLAIINPFTARFCEINVKSDIFGGKSV